MVTIRTLPHVAVAGRIDLTPERNLIVTEWFYPGTVANLELIPRLSLDFNTTGGKAAACSY